MGSAAKTREAILKAAHDIACREGVHALGVNQISAMASVSKPLIYRYFGGLIGVIEALRLLSGLDDIVKLPKGNNVAISVISMARKLAGNRLALQFLAADMAGEPKGRGSLAKRASPDEARRAMLMAAVCFILMRSQSDGTWLGLSLNSPNDLAVFERAALDVFMQGDV